MLDKEINSILNMDISNSKKSEILLILFKLDGFEEKENIEMKREGGDIKKLRPTEDITIGGIEYSVEIADTPEKREDGLSRVQSLKEDEGMLFIHPNVTDGYYTMADTDVDLDIVFIDEDQSVIKVSSVKARTPDPIKCTGFKYVLEVPIDSGIEKGDDLELDFELDEDEQEDLKKHSKSKMLVLDSNGDVQMKLEGGERIVSMIKTRQLIKAALKAYHSDEDSDYRKVGKLIFKELDALDGRDPQYVTKLQYGGISLYLSENSMAQELAKEVTLPIINFHTASKLKQTTLEEKPYSFWESINLEYGVTPNNSITISNSKPKSATGKQVINYLMSKGLSQEAATGAAKVFLAESGLRVGIRNLQEMNLYGDSKAGIGLAQWSNSRRKLYNDFMQKRGVTNPTLEDELDLFLEEGQSRPAFWNALTNARSVKDAVDAMYYGYENGSKNAMATRDQIINTYTAANAKLGRTFNIDNSLNARYNAQV